MCVAISAGHCDRHFCAGAFFLFLIKRSKHFKEDGFCPCEQPGHTLFRKATDGYCASAEMT